MKTNTKLIKRCSFKLFAGIMIFFLLGYANLSTWTKPKKSEVMDTTRDDAKNILDTATKIQDSVCDSFHNGNDFKTLCAHNFVKDLAQEMLKGKHVNVIQIGAHVGFERNDPLASGLLRSLDQIVAQDNSLRKHLHWTFIEPSPPSFKRLSDNLSSKKDLCDMNGINVGIVPDSMSAEEREKMVFYSFSESIDPETGYDSLSKKTLPYYVTQVSSFNTQFVEMGRKAFEDNGLNINDYIVKTSVTVKSYTGLMEEIVQVQTEIKAETAPLLVLIDTEGFDCSIINSISSSSPYLPKHLVFENLCDTNELNVSEKRVKDLGYILQRKGKNHYAVRVGNKE